MSLVSQDLFIKIMSDKLASVLSTLKIPKSDMIAADRRRDERYDPFDESFSNDPVHGGKTPVVSRAKRRLSKANPWKRGGLRRGNPTEERAWEHGWRGVRQDPGLQRQMAEDIAKRNNSN